MPVTTTHPHYDLYKDKVSRVRSCYQGSDAVKEKGTEYLPKLGGQSQAEYDAYLNRGYFLPTVEPTITALVGAVMRKASIIELPSSIDYLIDSVDGNIREFDLFLSFSLNELMQAGRVGALVEHDGERVKILSYRHEHIINWSSDFVVLKQCYIEPDEKDEFVMLEKDEYLELRIVEGVYIQRKWRQTKSGWAVVDTIMPTNRGEPIDYIPFVCCNSVEVSIEPSMPALLSITDVNLDHYRLSTDLRHGLHWTALPTLFVWGDLEDDDGNKAKISVGSGRGNHIADTEGRAELLEFTGAGLGSVSDTIAECVVAMAGLGAKMLASNSGGVKAAETARIESSSQTATLSTLAGSVEAFAQEVLKICAMWESGEGEINVKLNRDYIDASIEPAKILALLQALQSGSISVDTFLDNLMRGEILPKGVDIEDEKEKIINEGRSTVELDGE